VCKCVRYLGSKGAKRADLPGNIGAHHILQCQLGGQGGEIAQQTVLLLRRSAINDVITPVENGQQFRNFFGRMLQIVVDGDNHTVLAGADSAQ
jgi:hypothetical protein